MTHQEASLIGRLCEAERPRGFNDWEGREGYYVTACRVSADDVPSLLDLARRWFDPEWPANGDAPDLAPDRAQMLPVTAWRALADLQADVAVEPLVEMLRACDSEDDEWSSEELPHVLGRIGESAIEPLARLAKDADAPEFARSTATRGLGRVGRFHTDTRDRVIAALMEMLAEAADEDVWFNTTLMVELVELRAVAAAELIEQAFARNLIDCGMIGNWEDVRRKLGVQGLGLEMPERPFSSLERFRTEVGAGVFSDAPIFLQGEINEDAARAYCEQARATFSQSGEARQVIDDYGRLGWFQTLLDFGISYLGETVDAMSVASMQEFVLDYVPRKVSTEPEGAASIIGELTKFWEFLGRVYDLPQADTIVAWLESDGLVDQLEAELSDSSNFGLAKSMVMMGQSAGYDMTSEQGFAEFMAAYNQAVVLGKSPTPTPTPTPDTNVARQRRVGRNDPCPCGSGKKFKKCCR